MKTGKFTLALTFVLLSAGAGATEIIDSKTVYSPKLNICVSSFGGLIQSQEIIIYPAAEIRVMLAKAALVHWIENKNAAGFYLSELDTTQFYWQFVETKKHLGVILTVAGSTIDPDFYTSLGSGLEVPGRNIYGTDQGLKSNSDMFSFVINKKDGTLEHFENWRFSNPDESPKWMTSSPHHRLSKHK